MEGNRLTITLQANWSGSNFVRIVPKIFYVLLQCFHNDRSKYLQSLTDFSVLILGTQSLTPPRETKVEMTS